MSALSLAAAALIAIINKENNSGYMLLLDPSCFEGGFSACVNASVTFEVVEDLGALLVEESYNFN